MTRQRQFEAATERGAIEDSNEGFAASLHAAEALSDLIDFGGSFIRRFRRIQLHQVSTSHEVALRGADEDTLD